MSDFIMSGHRQPHSYNSIRISPFSNPVWNRFTVRGRMHDDKARLTPTKSLTRSRPSMTKLSIDGHSFLQDSAEVGLDPRHDSAIIIDTIMLNHQNNPSAWISRKLGASIVIQLPKLI